MLIRSGNSAWLLLGLSLLAAFFCYMPGSSGTFLLDDFGSLSPLGDLNVIDNLEKLKQYVLGGVTGPGGRPFSLLTFVANSRTWPADPYPFLLTNIGIHLLNGLLLFCFLRALLTAAGMNEASIRFLSIVATALWVLHPFHVSTVLYIVQRMTLLAATFSFLVFISYIKARTALNSDKVAIGLLYMLFAGIAAVLGFFSKETVVLLPVQILIIEIFLALSNPTPNKRMHKMIVWGCVVPAAIVVLSYPMKTALVHVWQYFQTGVEQTYNRDFSMLERLLTQQRIVGDYLSDLIIPKMQSAGVFFDGYPLSISLVEPISTLIWIAIHGALISSGWLLRKSCPVVCFGVLWFYGSHIIESTVIMLELKFEHRNYLASVGLMLVVAYGLSRIRVKATRTAIATAVVSIYGLLLVMSTQLWGQPLQAALVWTNKSPFSTRAIEHAVTEYINIYGKDAYAEDLLRKGIILSKRPTSELKFIDAFCKTYDGGAVDWEGLAGRIASEPRDWALYNVMQRLLSNHLEGRCELLELEGYRMLLHAYKHNPAYNRSSSLYIMEDLEIRAALAFGEPILAKQLMLDFRADFLVPLAFQMNRTLYMAEYGELQFAINELDRAIQIADQLGNESLLTVKNAKEILQLMQLELENPSSAE
jgi:hypothetical protein